MLPAGVHLPFLLVSNIIHITSTISTLTRSETNFIHTTLKRVLHSFNRFQFGDLAGGGKEAPRLLLASSAVPCLGWASAGAGGPFILTGGRGGPPVLPYAHVNNPAQSSSPDNKDDSHYYSSKYICQCSHRLEKV